MSTAKFHDKFERDDGDIGAQYTVPCGGAAIFDESVIPVDLEEITTGDSPILAGTTLQNAQILYTGDELDGADYAVRGVWSRLDESYVNTAVIDAALNDPSFTLLARMSKDPLIVDLGREEQPLCFDQGYGLRVTCPRGGGLPILKLVKLTPRALAPGFDAPDTDEPDEAVVLASFTLTNAHLNTDPEWDGTGNPPYQSFVQDMRLRIRRSNDQVLLDAYFNDRNRNTPVLSFIDYKHPLWGDKGVPGFQFLSAAEGTQVGTSPFALAAIPIMFCHLFEVETIKDTAPARASTPENIWTYERCAQRAILLCEKQGDAKYTASLNGQTKLAIYTDFVYEAEQNILAMEGYWWFLLRTAQRVYLKEGLAVYELQEDCGELINLSPSWCQPPLQEIEISQWDRVTFANRGVGGQPRIFRRTGPQTNDRLAVELWPVPNTTADNFYLNVDYYARQFRAVDPSAQVPLIPQNHINALIYTAATLAMVLDTDIQNMQALGSVGAKMVQDLVRANNRNVGSYRPQMIYAGHLPQAQRMPLTRMNQLGLNLP